MMKSNENNGAVTKSFAKKMESISPFELKNKLIEMADESIKKIAHTMLNAGRGNPNWIATTPREAFFLLGKFGLEECRRVMYLPEGIAGIPQKDGIAARFETFLKTNHSQPGAELLKGTYQYMLLEHAADPDTLVHEWAEGVVGDQYPVPDRILQFTEMIVQDYLAQEMCDRRPPKGKYDLFATEGGTAAMCYVFDSLQENFLLNKGDGIALMVPVFTPYIEIPQLRRYEFNVTEISADQMTTDGLHTWQYKDEDIDRLRNPQIKALFITNPSNPPSYTLSPETAARIVNIVKKDNPNLMIITDDVYGTFSPHFRSLMAELPQNTLCVYSFSKYFGATGWRDAVIIATPTEAAGVGALVALILAICYKQFSWKMLYDSVIDTAKTSAMVFIILFGAAAFTGIFMSLDGDVIITNFVMSLGVGRLGALAIMLILVFIMGMFTFGRRWLVRRQTR